MQLLKQQKNFLRINSRPNNTRSVRWPLPPWNVVVVVARTGTLNGKNGIVMADELMANAVANGFKDSSDLISSVQVVSSEEEIEKDIHVVFMMHWLPESKAWKTIGDRPAWLWIQNASVINDLSILKVRAEKIQGLWHAGKKTSSRLNLNFWEFGVEDTEVFKPQEKTARIVYVGNSVMHQNSIMLIGKFCNEFKEKFFLFGSGWDHFGLPNNGILPMSLAGYEIGKSYVALDTVSQEHINEGMCSTRIFQAMACETAVVTMQPKDNIPAWAIPYMTFAEDESDALRKAAKLLGDPIERSIKTNGSRKAALNYSIKNAAKIKWMDIENSINSMIRR